MSYATGLLSAISCWSGKAVGQATGHASWPAVGSISLACFFKRQPGWEVLVRCATPLDLCSEAQVPTMNDCAGGVTSLLSSQRILTRAEAADCSQGPLNLSECCPLLFAPSASGHHVHTNSRQVLARANALQAGRQLLLRVCALDKSSTNGVDGGDLLPG